MEKVGCPDLADKCLKGVTRLFTTRLVFIVTGEAQRSGLIIICIQMYIYVVNLRCKMVGLLVFLQEVNMDVLSHMNCPSLK